MHDELILVISGSGGATVIETPEGKKYSLEWGPTAIFGIGMNEKHQIFNGSGTEARKARRRDRPAHRSSTSSATPTSSSRTPSSSRRAPTSPATSTARASSAR